MVFETERLSIRPLGPADITGFFELQGNPKVMRYTTGQAQTLAEAEEDLKRVIEKTADAKDGFHVWGLFQKEDGAMVGTCAVILAEEEGKKVGEIGYRLLERMWGKGYGKEIGRGLVKYGLEGMGLEGLLAYTAKENAGSLRILESLGMTFAGEHFEEKYGWWEMKFLLWA